MNYNANFDFNNVESGMGDFDLIPDGTIAKLVMTIRPGGQGDGGWLTPSNSSDAQYLNCEFTVSEGKYAKRKLWQNMTVSGGKVDADGNSIAGNITRSMMRAILESARNIKPTDESDQAKKARCVGGYGDFNGMEFTAKIGIEKGTNGYKDKNKILSVITPDKEGYGGVSAGSGQAAPAQQQSAPPAQQAASQGQSAVPAWAR